MRPKEPLYRFLHHLEQGYQGAFCGDPFRRGPIHSQVRERLEVESWLGIGG